MLICHSSSWPPNTTSDIKDTVASGNSCHGSQRIRRGYSTHVDHIELVQILDFDRVGSDSLLLKELECALVSDGQS
jgi:hypothetical protein